MSASGPKKCPSVVFCVIRRLINVRSVSPYLSIPNHNSHSIIVVLHIHSFKLSTVCTRNKSLRLTLYCIHLHNKSFTLCANVLSCGQTASVGPVHGGVHGGVNMGRGSEANVLICLELLLGPWAKRTGLLYVCMNILLECHGLLWWWVRF